MSNFGKRFSWILQNLHIMCHLTWVTLQVDLNIQEFRHLFKVISVRWFCSFSHYQSNDNPHILRDDCIQNWGLGNNQNTYALSLSKPSNSTQTLITRNFVTASKHGRHFFSNDSKRSYPKSFHRKIEQNIRGGKCWKATEKRNIY